MTEPRPTSLLDRLPTPDEVRREIETQQRNKRLLRQLLALAEAAQRQRKPTREARSGG